MIMSSMHFLGKSAQKTPKKVHLDFWALFPKKCKKVQKSATWILPIPVNL